MVLSSRKGRGERFIPLCAVNCFCDRKVDRRGDLDVFLAASVKWTSCPSALQRSTVRNSRAVRNRGPCNKSRLQKVGGEDLRRLHGEERAAIGRASTMPSCATLMVSRTGTVGGGGDKLCRVEHFVDELTGDERTRTVLHGAKIPSRARPSSAARSTDSVRVGAADDDLYGFSEAKRSW